jgi:hypothetical protein
MNQLPAPVDRRPHEGVLDCARGNEVNFSAQQLLQGPLQPEVSVKKTDRGIRFELDRKIDVTAGGVEVIASRSRAKDFKPPYVKAPANVGDLGLFAVDQWVHGDASTRFPFGTGRSGFLPPLNGQ